MALNFPASPALDDIHTDGNYKFQWDGDKWVSIGPEGNFDEIRTSTGDNAVRIRDATPSFGQPAQFSVRTGSSFPLVITPTEAEFDTDVSCDNIKTNSIKNASTNDGGIAIDSSGHVQIDGQQLPSAGALSNRNLVINGGMQVDQRGTSTGITTAGYYAVDRMRFSETSVSNATYTREQSTDAPDGFGSSLKVTTTTAEGSVAAADAYRPLQYRIEGQDLQQLQYGTSGAKNLTLSFYVKSSVTGTYGVTFQRLETQDRLITATYVISSANTWEYKTITIPGDTSSSITNDNTNRFEILWSGGSGTDRTATDTSGSWTNMDSTGFAFGHSSSVQLQNTLNSTWQIAGVQLEVGSVATPFEHRSYGDELAKCQRYFQDVGRFRTYLGDGSGFALETMLLPVVMREAPGTVDYTVLTGTNVVVSSTISKVQIQGTVGGSAPNRRIDANDITLSAEL